MSEQQFLTECEQLLTTIEDVLDASELDIDFERNGHVLEIEFEDSSKIVVNGQVPMREIWLAAPSGAHHFKKDDSGRWVDTRSAENLSAVLSRCASAQGGQQVMLKVD
ncbi:MAG: iron donor protein CyaY [Burkholderiaceae bacterium]